MGRSFRARTAQDAGAGRSDGRALKALGLNNDISATNDYTVPQQWARAVHDASPRWDGVRYVSRQMNKGVAYAIFDRSALLKLSAVRLTAR
jgi:hypothetical protein